MATKLTKGDIGTAPSICKEGELGVSAKFKGAIKVLSKEQDTFTHNRQTHAILVFLGNVQFKLYIVYKQAKELADLVPSAHKGIGCPRIKVLISTWKSWPCLVSHADSPEAMSVEHDIYHHWLHEIP